MEEKRESLVEEGVVTFQTKITTRILGMGISTLIGGGFLVLSFIVGAIVYFIIESAFGMPLVVSIATGVVVWAFFFRYALKITIAPLRFCIILHPEFVQVGHGCVKSIFPYDEVEKISVPEPVGPNIETEDKRQEHGVGIQSGRKEAFVHLTPAREASCVEMLRKKCHHAIYVDAWGQEHFPPEGDGSVLPLITTFNRRRELRRACLYRLVGGIFLILVLVTTVFVQIINGAAQLSSVKIWLYFLALIGIVVSSLRGIQEHTAAMQSTRNAILELSS